MEVSSASIFTVTLWKGDSCTACLEAPVLGIGNYNPNVTGEETVALLFCCLQCKDGAERGRDLF